MSLALNFTAEISDDGKTITITETTGIYSATSNSGGWTSPNPAIASALTATITLSQLIDGDNSIYSIPVVISAYPTLPNTTSTIFSFTAQTAGYGLNATFPDAVYSLIYTVTGNSGGAYSASTTLQFSFTHVIDCAVKTLTNKVSLCDCGCGPLFQTYSKISAQKRLFDSTVNCGNTQQIFKDIAFLNSELANSNCNCG